MILAYAVFGIAAYCFFHVAFPIFDGWMMNWGRELPQFSFLFPFCIDGCSALTVQPTSTAKAIAINLLLIFIFAVQHTGMARTAFKQAITKVFPKRLERSLYVAAACVGILQMAAFWQPLPQLIYKVPDSLAPAFVAVHYLGWIIVILCTFMLGHFPFLGVTPALQDVERPVKETQLDKELSTVGFYKYVRHPIMTGSFLALWSAHNLTVGRLVLNIGLTLYILIAVKFFEEPDLRKELGDKYRRYEATTPAYFPFGGGDAKAPRRGGAKMGADGASKSN